ncbi:MAG: 1,4-alpha-glucan branching protein GlgB [Alphaproteobacteria bacterium]|nr:1,4-alpha-glucan branching protein GlgB [Alphaproteobacteria bacterium]
MKENLSESFKHSLMTNGYGDPFSILGMHKSDKGGLFVRVCYPGADKIEVISYDEKKVLGVMDKIHSYGLFQLNLPDEVNFFPYKLHVYFLDGRNYISEDPYRFEPVLSDFDLYLLNEGTHKNLYDKLGAHLIRHQGVDGVFFAVWAPNAKRVSVIGNFNTWDGRRHMMRNRAGHGIWEIFIPNLVEGEFYKYEIVDNKGQVLPLKADPVGFAAELRPNTASAVYNPKRYQWSDEKWMKERKENQDILHKPMSIYEVHLGSWRRNSLEGNRFLTYRELALELPEYVKYMGFTHVEFLPVSEHPFDGSWGYQTLGLYAPTARYGNPDDFKFLVDCLHREGIGVIIDWVPAHFPKDTYGLDYFDGTALYEHADSRKGEQKDWGTKVYNYGRNEVANFLLANALFWIREYHIDGLRVDAVASMLYLDYGRKPGEWIPNQYGGHENIEAISFLRRLNEWVYGENSGAVTFAEESTSWPMVSRPTYVGGLGFTFKWNMGWMNDTLQYMHRESVYRKYHQSEMTFSFVYAFNENFVLPLSHDEVVHGKGPLIDKMTGDRWQKFANLRAYFTFMYAHPGKQLLFMGNEFAQDHEWRYDDSLSWNLLLNSDHSGIQKLVKDLNELHKTEPALHQLDFEEAGFEWIDGADVEHSVISFIRKSNDPDDFLVCVTNFTPAPLRDYKVGVNKAGIYTEIFNSDNLKYGGSGVLNQGDLKTVQPGWNFKDYALNLTIPPLATIILKPKQLEKEE